MMIPIPKEGMIRGKPMKMSDEKLIVRKDVRDSAIEKIRKQLGLKEVAREEKLIGNTCFKMIKYIDADGRLSKKDLEELICDMQRAVMCLQKKKKKKIERKFKKER